VRWKGIDVLTVDTKAKPFLIESVVSSADWFKYEYDAGAKIVFQKHHFPACLCQDPAPGLNSNGQCTATPSAPAPTTSA
jgi:hypothetical protein